MADVQTRITRRIKKTVTLDHEQVEKLVREAVGCPKDADVDFDCGYDCLREVRVTWEWEEAGD